MGNERVSQLNALTWNNVLPNDLLLIVDISATQSKQITAEDLQTFVLNDGNVTASLNGTASWANTAIYALNAPSSNQVNYSTSSLSSSYASSSINSISSSYTSTASFATTASYALVANALTSAISTNSINADSASFLIYTGNYNGTASYSINSGTSNFTSYSADGAHAALSDTASIALTASALANNGVNMSGYYNATSFGASQIFYDRYYTNFTSSIYGQLDDVYVKSSNTNTNTVNIIAHGILYITMNDPWTYLNPTGLLPYISLNIEDLSSKTTQSLQSFNYSQSLSNLQTYYSHPAIVSANQYLRFYFNQTASLNGSYRIYVNINLYGPSFYSPGSIDYGRVPLITFLSSSCTFGVFSNAQNLIIQSASSAQLLTSDVIATANYSASWVFNGTPTSSYGSDTIQNLSAAGSSSYLTYLQLTSPCNIITGGGYLSSIQTLILDNQDVTSIDFIPPSAVTFSAVNCNSMTTLPIYTDEYTYNLGYLNVNGCNILECPNLPVSLSYMDFSNNQNINFDNSGFSVSSSYINLTNCGLTNLQLDELTSGVLNNIFLYNGGGSPTRYPGTYTITNNVPSINGTLTKFLSQYFANYAWTFNN